MSEQELTKKILDYMMQLYSAEYVGYIKVTKDGGSYTLTLGVPSYMQPTCISFDGSDEEFLDYIYEELRVRNLMRVEIYKVVKEEKNGNR